LALAPVDKRPLLLYTAAPRGSAQPVGAPAHGLDACHPLKRLNEGRLRLQVVVRDNNVDQALRALKKKLQREGVFREMKLRNYYEKPSEKKARQKAEAVRRARKLARKRAQREGGLPAPSAAARPAGAAARPAPRA
jgi:small subunit ribosomal protein S21